MTEPEPVADARTVAKRLREAREAIGFTQEEVGAALGLQRTSVLALEAGRRNVSALELRRFARLYRRRIDWLLGEEAENVSTDGALYRATEQLSDADKTQVLRFAQFLAASDGNPPSAGPRVS